MEAWQKEVADRDSVLTDGGTGCAKHWTNPKEGSFRAGGILMLI